MLFVVNKLSALVFTLTRSVIKSSPDRLMRAAQATLGGGTAVNLRGFLLRIIPPEVCRFEIMEHLFTGGGASSPCHSIVVRLVFASVISPSFPPPHVLEHCRLWCGTACLGYPLLAAILHI